MKTKTVEYRRVVNLGDYENMRLGTTIELEEGDSPDDAFKVAYSQVHEQIKEIEEQKKAEYDAEREARQPWRFKPEMVADIPTLRQKAKKAAELSATWSANHVCEIAQEKAREFFGIDAVFLRGNNGKAWAEVDGMTLVYDFGSFDVKVPVEGQEEPRVLGNVTSLPQLGQWLARAEQVEDDIPY